MKKYVALLRGINVGGNKKVEMSKLKRCFEDLGYTNVSTYINSGNVIFETSATKTEILSEKIEKTLKKKFGFEIKTLVVEGSLIKRVVKEVPASWKNDSEQKTDVLFLWKAFANKKSLDLLKITPKIDTLKYIDGAIVWNLKKENYSKSGMHDLIGTKIYKNMTARNINTTRKIAEILNAQS